MPHRHFVCIQRGDPPVPWDPEDPTDRPVPDCGYLGGVVRELERQWRGRSLTIYVSQDLQWLPTYGPDVVVFLLNDEWFRTPAYSGEVGVILRNLRGKPWFPWRSVLTGDPAAALGAANHLRVLLERRQFDRHSREVARREGWRPPTPSRTVDIPLGYFEQPSLPLRPFDERTTDVFFGGSLVHDLDRGEAWRKRLKQTVGNPKQQSRSAMLRSLEHYATAHPELRRRATVSSEAKELSGSDITGYAEAMMDARIALVPRGTAAESYRLFEAWRYGCVVVGEPLPPSHLYRHAPRVELTSWRQLPKALDQLLADPERLRRLHAESLSWWRDRCSPEVTGRHCAEALRRMLPARAV